MPKRYRKKPVTVEAMQLTLDSANAVAEWVLANGGEIPNAGADELGRPFLVIRTLEGDHRASEGDYIIKGIKGEFYPCKPDIFEATYEVAEG